MSRKVAVFAEVREGVMRHVSYEALAVANQMANGGEVIAVVLGEKVDTIGKELIYFGADRVIIVNHSQLKDYTTDAYLQAMLQVLEKEEPDGLLLGHTSNGKDIAPRIASKLEVGLISDIVDMEDESGEVIFTRPIYSGKAFEKRKVNEGMIFATVRPNNFSALDKDEFSDGKVSQCDVELVNLRTVIKDVVKNTTEGVDLSEAKVVVAGGRGVKSEEGFTQLQELANLLGGAVGASRGACDAEFCDYALQIGQTGKVVTPDLYFAFGISGAIQHLAGMSRSKTIVAINKDPEAPIFNIADYGIVGDLFEIMPILIEEIQTLKTQSKEFV